MNNVMDVEEMNMLDFNGDGNQKGSKITLSARIAKRIEVIKTLIEAVKHPHKIVSLAHRIRKPNEYPPGRFYGLGKTEMWRDEEHYYIIPLHWIVTALRAMDYWYWRTVRHKMSSFDADIIEAYNKGIYEGMKREREHNIMLAEKISRRSVLKNNIK